MIDKVSFTSKEGFIIGRENAFVRASMDLTGTPNAKMLRQPIDYLERFIGSDFSPKSVKPAITIDMPPELSYAYSHGQKGTKLNIAG